MPSYRLLKTAESDLATIAEYTIENFGVEQSRVYRDGPVRRVRHCFLEFRHLGVDKSHIRQNLRRDIHKFHATYYRADHRGVVVIRILGPEEDPLHPF